MSAKLSDDRVPVLLRVRSLLSRLAAFVDGLATRLAQSGGVFVWLALYAMSLGGTVFVAAHRDYAVQAASNKLDLEDSLVMAQWVAAAFAILLVVQLVVVTIARLRQGAFRTIAVASEVNRRLRPLLVLPFIPALLTPAIEKESPKETLFWITLVAAIVGAGVYAWSRAPASEPLTEPDPAPELVPWSEAIGPVAAALAVLALGVGYAAYFSTVSVANHHALNTRTTDLGYYDNIFWQSIHGKPLGCSFIKAGYHGSAHFDPLLVVLSPLYLLYPRAEFLLVLQSVWLGAGVFPVYLLARHKLGSRGSAVAIAAMYAVYPALHGANMYEFHSLTLLTPILLWLLYFLETEALKRYWVALAVALLCREDVSLLMCFVSLHAILSGRPKLARTGWLTICASAVYFVVVKRFFMVSHEILNTGGKDSYSFEYYYEDLIPNKNGAGGLLVSLVTSPLFALKTMLAEPKILYLLTLFVPLVFLPFFARRGRIMLAYGLLFSLLASRAAVYSVHFQYSSVIIPIAFALTPVALRRIEDSRRIVDLGLDGTRLRRALVGAALAASVLVSWKFGGLVKNETFRGGFMPVARGLTDKTHETYAWLREAVAEIPPGASVGTTNRLGAHVSNRKNVFFYPTGRRPDYALVDEGELKPGDLEKHRQIVQQGDLVLVSRHDRLALYKKP